MRTIIAAAHLAILVVSSALLVGCTDDLSVDQRDLEVPLPEETVAAVTAGDAVPCPTPLPGFARHDAIEKRDALDEAPADFCAELPSEGPCSLACDPDAMIDQYVPQGQCVTYRCELASGQVFRTGGCNP